MEEKFKMKTFLKYLGKFLITHCIWIVPLVVLSVIFGKTNTEIGVEKNVELSMPHDTTAAEIIATEITATVNTLSSKPENKFNPMLLLVVVIPFLVTFIFLSWQKNLDKEKKGKQLSILKSSPPITALYYAVIGLFLLLTMYATYCGMKKVFSMENDGFWVAIGISFGVPLALLTIILFTKSRKTPEFFVSAFVLYILFDFLVALPFNFLYFHDHLTKTQRAETAATYCQTVTDDCESIIAPKVKYFSDLYASLTDTTFYNDISQQQNASLASQRSVQTKGDDAQREEIDKAVERGDYTKEEGESKKRAITDKSLKGLEHKTNEAVKKITANKPTEQEKKSAKDSLDFYNNMGTLLDNCKNLQNELANASNLDSKISKIDLIRTNLSKICHGSNSDFLKSKAILLKAEQQSSIMSIRQFYKWFFEKIKGVKDVSITEEQRWNTVMSFSISVVIDILPLLLSLLFIMYKRND